MGRITPTFIDRIEDRNGRTIFQHDKRLCDGCSAQWDQAQAAPGIPDTRERFMAGALLPVPVIVLRFLKPLPAPAEDGAAGNSSQQLAYETAAVEEEGAITPAPVSDHLAVAALAAQQVFHGRVAVGFFAAEEVDVFRGLRHFGTPCVVFS